MKKFVLSVIVAIAVTVPAIWLRLGGLEPAPLVQAGVFGAAILAAGFLLSWGAETAEGQISAGLILALVALVTVLPEYAVDIYYAYQAGQDPNSDYVHYAAANMTGANRLLVGLAWPLLVLLNWTRHREGAVKLEPVNAVEIFFLLAPSLYAFVILAKGSIGPLDAVVLIAIFGAYLWRVSRLPKPDESEEGEEPGFAAVLDRLPIRRQWAIIIGLTLVAAAVIILSAEPFAESMVASGRVIGIDEFLLIQWLAPLASEAPAITVAVLFVLSARAAGGLTTMISDKINQWTLLVGMLPLAMSVGAGALMELPLDNRQREEFFLTAAQSLFGIALLLRLKLGIRSAVGLALLFFTQVAIALVFRNDEARTIQSLTTLAWLYLALAAVIAATNRKQLWSVLATALEPRRTVTAKTRREVVGPPRN